MTSALDLVVFTESPVFFGPFWSFYSRTLGLSVSRGPRSEVRGPFRSSLRRRRFAAFSDVRALDSRSFLRSDSVHLTEVRGLSGLSTLGLSVSRSLEVRGPRSFGTLYYVSACGLSMTSALDLVVFTESPVSFGSFWSFYSRTLGLSVSRGPRSEVRGPFRSSLRRRRFPAFSDVRALVSRSFLWSDSVHLTEVRGLSGLSTLGLSVSRSLEVRGPRSFGTLYLRLWAFYDVRA